MGVYSTNRIELSGINLDDVVANENYSGEIGIQTMLIEGYQNDMAIFEAILKNDMQETMMLKEGTILESELQALAEAGTGGLWATIKEALIKFWAKIQGILESFEKKFLDTVDAANKKLLETIKGKIEKKDLSGLKYNWREEKSGIQNIDMNDINAIATRAYNDIDGTKEDIAARIEKYNDGKLTNEMLDSIISGATLDNFAELYEKDCFEEVKEVEGLDITRLKNIIDDLSTFIPAEKRQLAKAKSSINSKVKEELRKIEKNYKNTKKESEDKDAIAVAGKAAEGYRIVLNSWKAATLAILAAHLRVVKVKAAQDRAIINKAFMYNPKAKSEEAVNASAILFAAMDECAAYELEELACY